MSKGLIKSEYEKNRDYLVEQMKKYYHDSSEKIYHTWSDSEIQAWLVDHTVIKPEAQAKREKLIKLISSVIPTSAHSQTPISLFLSDNFSNARDTIWSSWSDSDIRSWLVENGYLKSDAQVNRDELVKLINEK